MRRAHSVQRDRGSITPLLIGMVVCLLLLGFGVIAMGSVVLAKRSLQNACDGAADAVTGQQVQGALSGASPGYFDATAQQELRYRIPTASVHTETENTALIAVCAVEAPITLGSLFGSPTISLQVRSVSRVDRN